MPIRISFSRKITTEQWGDGNEGVEWKSRDLRERRAVAEEMLFNVGKRQLISDAVRLRSKQNVERFSSDRSAQSSIMNDVRPEDSNLKLNFDSELVGGLQTILACEWSEELIKHVPLQDIEFLRGELYEMPHTGDESSLRGWFNLRKHADNSFGSLPAEERTPWSAWYLRDVKSKG